MAEPEKGVESQQQPMTVLYERAVALAPIGRLPLEILGEVFLHSIPENHRFSRADAPLSLCKVCSLWREIAMSTCALWANIAFWTPLSNTGRMCYPIRYVDQWFSFSGTLPISISFERGIIIGHAQVFSEIFMYMKGYSRSRHLDISLTGQSAFALIHFVNLPPGSLRNLETLVLEGLDESDFYIASNSPTTTSGITVFQDSPRLRKFTTDRLDFTYSLVEGGRHAYTPHVLPWPQLTEIVITDFVEVEDFVAALSECRALQFLRVSLFLWQRTVALENRVVRPKVVLPHLTEIYISAKGGCSIPSAMNIFTFPALKHLHFRRSLRIIGQFGDTHDLFSWLGSGHFLNQLHQLQRLTLVGQVGRPKQVIALLQCLPNLTKLTLDIYTSYQDLIPALFPFGSVEPLLPLLTDLDLYPLEVEVSIPLSYIRCWVEPGEPCLLQNLRINTESEEHKFRARARSVFPETFTMKLWMDSPSRSARGHNDSSLISSCRMGRNHATPHATLYPAFHVSFEEHSTRTSLLA